MNKIYGSKKNPWTEDRKAIWDGSAYEKTGMIEFAMAGEACVHIADEAEAKVLSSTCSGHTVLYGSSSGLLVQIYTLWCETTCFKVTWNYSEILRGSFLVSMKDIYRTGFLQKKCFVYYVKLNSTAMGNVFWLGKHLAFCHLVSFRC